MEREIRAHLGRDQIHTLIGILNTDTQEAKVEVSLDYYDGGLRRSYELPERVIPARASELIDIGALVAAGAPDEDGDVIPPGVTTGGYRLRKVGPRLNKNLTTEALIFDRRRKSFTTFYNTCCGFSGVRATPGQIVDVIGFNRQLFVEGRDQCLLGWFDATSSAGFSSNNTPVATVGSQGLVVGAGVGTADVKSELEMLRWVRIEGGICVAAAIFALTDTDVTPSVTITLGPFDVPLRAAGSTGPNSITLSAQGNPTGGNYKWSTTSSKVTLSNDTSPTVTVTAVTESASVGDVPIKITYTLNEQPATATRNVTVQKPTSLTIVPGTSSTTSETPCTTSGGLAGCGVERTFRYQVRDQLGRFMIVGGMPFWDSIQAGSPNTCNLAGFQTTCSPPNTGPCGQSSDFLGQFNERLFICAPACRSTTGICIIGCTTSASQIWSVNGFSIVKQLSYQCDRILSDGL